MKVHANTAEHVMANDLLFQRVLKKYTRSQQCTMQDFPDAHTVWLDVGSQHFCITPEGVEDKDQAYFMRRMLAEALTNIINEHCGARKND
jgi:hypothetical protein